MSIFGQSWKLELESLREDLRVNHYASVKIMLGAYRIGRAVQISGAPKLLKLSARKMYALVFNLTAIPLGGGQLTLKTVIGPGIKFPHRLGGTVIHPEAKIGAHAIIYHQVTLGRTKFNEDGSACVPTIGDNVTIYPGAKVLGDLFVGNGSIIGANAVVLQSVPPGGRAFAPKANVFV